MPWAIEPSGFVHECQKAAILGDLVESGVNFSGFEVVHSNLSSRLFNQGER
jgi:hypothetical protein